MPRYVPQIIACGSLVFLTVHPGLLLSFTCPFLAFAANSEAQLCVQPQLAFTRENLAFLLLGGCLKDKIFSFFIRRTNLVVRILNSLIQPLLGKLDRKDSHILECIICASVSCEQ